MNSRHARPVVIGVGNAMRRDDGAGPAVCRNLIAKGHAADVCIIQHADVAQCISAWTGRNAAIVVDAKVAGDAPGDIIHSAISAGEDMRDLFDSELGRASAHGFGVAHALKLAMAIGAAPQSVFVYMIEGADFSHGEGLSPPVQGAVDELAASLERQYLCTV